MIIGMLMLFVGVALWFWTGRREFKRTNSSGVQEFSSYSSAAASRLLELLSNLVGLVLVIGGGLIAYFDVDFFRDPRMLRASQACEEFVAESMVSKPSLVDRMRTYTLDSWERSGAIVVDVGYKEAFGDRGTQLCVYNEAEGTLSLPSPFNESKWRK